jgi:signal peptidase I
VHFHSQCVGPSMLPTFNKQGDVALLEHVSVWAGRIRTGDVVVAKSVLNPRHIVCKRVLASAGERVPDSSYRGPLKTVRNNPKDWYRHVFTLSLLYKPRGRWLVQVPAGHVWLQGDNTCNSTDSREYGPVPYALLRGRVTLKVWPLSQFGLIR